MIGDLLKPETFGFFAAFLLAGYVWLSAQSRLVGQERLAISETLISAVILSLINQAVYQLISLFIPVLPLLPAPGEAAFYVQVLAMPAILGLLTGWLLSRDWTPDGLRRLVFPLSRPTEDAFEVAFMEAEAPCYIIVSYADGREVFGFFGKQSFAGTDRVAGGLYLERLYVPDNAGVWKPAEPARSAWVSLTDARSIEFVVPEGGQDAKDAG